MPADDKREPDNARGEISPEDREAFKRRAEALGRKLEGAKGQPPGRAPRTDGGVSGGGVSGGNGVTDTQRGNALGQALRISVDLLAGVGVGGGLGWLAQQQFPSIKPWGLVVGLLVGFAAGMMNVIRTARQLQKQAEPMQRSAKSVKDEPEET